MNLHTVSLSRLFSKGKHQSEPRPEMEQSQFPVESFGLLPVNTPMDEPAECILDDNRRAACDRSSAGVTVFIP